VAHRSLVSRLGLAGALALVPVLLAGCGTAVRSAAPSASQLAADYRGAPAPLAALHRKANTLLGGGVSAFERELRALRGHPVVVDVWASWCQNCEQEFSIFQRVAPKFARTVAFIGDDYDDGKGARWLARFPLSFPSYDDHSTSIDRAIDSAITGGIPVTYFLNRKGVVVYPHIGPYLSARSLERDIRASLGA
jgi:thiol-disulfide isomerase/thioredoxin